MNKALQTQFKKLDADFIDLLEDLKQFSDSKLNKKPQEGAWSVLQVMHHLMLAERLSHQYLEKKLSHNPALEKAGLKSKMRSILLKTYLATPLKRKAPAAVGDNLPEESTFWEVVKQWKQQREELKAFLETLPDDMMNKELYKHPAAGKMTILDMLKFFDSHFTRHRKQINRNLKEYRNWVH